MAQLHLSKVAVGCASLDALRRRIATRREGDGVDIVTRFRPKRADELIGGSLFWIIKHQLVARQTILGFAARDGDKRTIIRLCAALVPVAAWSRRAHQGWRYLGPTDAPPDLAGAGDTDGTGSLPPELARALSGLALI